MGVKSSDKTLNAQYSTTKLKILLKRLAAVKYIFPLSVSSWNPSRLLWQWQTTNYSFIQFVPGSPWLGAKSNGGIVSFAN